MSRQLSAGKGKTLLCRFLPGRATDKGQELESREAEVDIIAETEEFIVFVEVKTRSEDFLESPQDAVTREKQRSLVLAADNYIRWYDIEKQVRFDVITVIAKGQTLIIEKHIEDAFYPTLR